MKQAILTIGIIILALGGALVAVFYQQSAYSDTIKALTVKAQDAQTALDAQKDEVAKLKDQVAQTQQALNQSSALGTKNFSSEKYGVSFDYPASYELTLTEAPAGQTSPGDQIKLKKGNTIIDMYFNPEGLDNFVERIYDLKILDNKLIIAKVTNQGVPEVADVNVAVEIEAQYAINDKEGLRILETFPNTDNTSESELLGIISSFRFTK